jgi:putative transcriptional regulator
VKSDLLLEADVRNVLHVDNVSQEGPRRSYTQAGSDHATTGQGGVQVKQQDFDRLVTSVKQAGAIRRGQLKPGRVTEFRPEDVRAIRGQLEKSQEEFALMIGVSVATLQNWEQGRRRPEGPARALLRVAAKNPQAVTEVLAS